MERRTIKFIDLFAGLGGMRLAFQQAFPDSECVFTSEIKPYAIEAINHNFNEKNKPIDITKIDEKSIPDFDFLLGGFPCQAFSTAGNRDGFCDTRGTLFFDIERILKYKKPKGFLLENVEGLVSHDKGNTLKVILNNLNTLGYNVSYKVLDSSKFSVPQNRKRIYIIGLLNATFDFSFIKETPPVYFKDIQENNLPLNDTHFSRNLLKNFTPEELYGKSIKDKRGGPNNIHSWDFSLRGEISTEQKELLTLLFKKRRLKKWAEEIGITWMDGMPLTLKQIKTFYTHPNLEEMLFDLVDKNYLKYEYPKEKITKIINGNKISRREYDTTKEKGFNIVTGKLSFEFSKILDPNDFSPTIVATDVNKIAVVDGKGIRELSIREGLRLFGYPESYDLSFLKKKEAFDLLGNTVTVPVLTTILKKVKKLSWF